MSLSELHIDLLLLGFQRKLIQVKDTFILSYEKEHFQFFPVHDFDELIDVDEEVLLHNSGNNEWIFAIGGHLIRTITDYKAFEDINKALEINVQWTDLN